MIGAFENLEAVLSMYICGGGGLGLGKNLTFDVVCMISGAIGFALKTAPPPVVGLASDAGGSVFSVFTTRIINIQNENIMVRNVIGQTKTIFKVKIAWNV